VLRLTYGQDWGHLVDAWWPVLAAGDPFEPTDILVPDAATARWLRLWVAERRGIASHWRTRRLDAWMEETVPELLTRSRLRDRFVEALARGEGPAPIRRWIEAALTERDLERRWIQLGARLAEGLSEVWAQLAVPELEPEVDAWVRSVVEDSGGWTVQQALERGAFRRVEGPGPLHVLDALPPRAGPVAALAQAAEVREVHLFASNPCVEFWEDLPRPTRRPSGNSAQAELDLEGLEENPLLVAWGQYARPLIRALDAASAGDFASCHRRPEGEAGLHVIQAEVLDRRSPGTRGPDDSLQTALFPSAEAEARWIAASIRRRLAEGAEPFELGVAVAGDDGAFRSALEAALPDVPLLHLDRRVLDRSPVFDGARRLWRLNEDSTGADLQDLLLHPNLAVPLDADERVQATGWVRASGMVEGLRGRLSWAEGLARLARDLLTDEMGLGRSPDAVARFLGFVRRLGRAIPSAVRRADRRSWMRVFRGLATQFLVAEDDGQERHLGLLLQLVGEHPPPGEPVWRHDMVWSLLEEEMGRLRRTEGPSAGVAVGRLGALARRPLRFAWVAQLDDRHFPRRGRPRPFGLPSQDLASEDRFAVLMRLMNTRDALSLSWAAGPDGERGSAAAAELGGPPPTTPKAPEPATTPAPLALPPAPAGPVRRLRPEDLIGFLLDPFEAWLRTLFGPPRSSRPTLQAALDLDLRRQRHLLERTLAELWPDETPRAFALDQLAPPDVPPSALAEASRARLADTLAAWQDSLHGEGLPLARIERRATPGLDFEGWELTSTSVWGMEDGRWWRVSAAPGRAGQDRLRAEAFVHHALANVETERASVHLVVDDEGARRVELGPWRPAEARTWLARLGDALIGETHDLHLPMDSAWALWEVRDRPEAERRRTWARASLRADPRSGLRVPSLEEAEAQVHARLGEVALRCL